MAIQLKKTRFAADKVYMVLTNHSRNAEEVVLRLSSIDYFDGVYFANVRSLDQDKHSLAEAALSVIDGIWRTARWLNIIKGLSCDEFIYYNLNVSTIQMFAFLYKRNALLKCSRLEEGILSYDMKFHDGYGNDIPSRIKLQFKIRELLGKRNLPECVKDFYCMYPELYHGKLNPVKIQQISGDEGLVNVLSKTFGFKLTDSDYKEKYIFFTSVCDFEGRKPIGEFEIVRSVAELVGKENLLVKTHPRDNRDVFEKEGLHIDSNSSIPWEAIQLSGDFKDKVLLSVSSNSILSSVLMTEKSPMAYYMYPMCHIKDNEIAEKSIEGIKNVLEKSHKKNSLTNVRVARKLNDILV